MARAERRQTGHPRQTRHGRGKGQAWAWVWWEPGRKLSEGKGGGEGHRNQSNASLKEPAPPAGVRGRVQVRVLAFLFKINKELGTLPARHALVLIPYLPVSNGSSSLARSRRVCCGLRNTRGKHWRAYGHVRAWVNCVHYSALQCMYVFIYNQRVYAGKS